MSEQKAATTFLPGTKALFPGRSASNFLDKKASPSG